MLTTRCRIFLALVGVQGEFSRCRVAFSRPEDRGKGSSYASDGVASAACGPRALIGGGVLLGRPESPGGGLSGTSSSSPNSVMGERETSSPPPTSVSPSSGTPTWATGSGATRVG